MTRILRYVLFAVTLLMAVDVTVAQVAQQIRGLHKVKRKETLFGIARQYDITVEQLLDANPEMNTPDYELKKGVVIRIPYPPTKPTAYTQTQPVQAPVPVKADDVRNRAIRVGIMLPLHDINGDGRRMVEYYRGILMACDSLKKMGISIDIRAWNTAEDCDITKVLGDKAAANRDIIFGPLYSKQMQQLSDFTTAHDIRLVIPFSINAPQLQTNRNIFQIWQSPTTVNQSTIGHYLQQFANYHPVFIDCNDTTSRKGPFTFGLRQQLEARHIAYSITNLKSQEETFAKAFSKTKPNMVILNTARSPELGVAFAKINGLKMVDPKLEISIFGYTEWLMYTRTHLENFYKYNAYIPSVFHYNPLSQQTERLQQKYRWNFHADMMNSLPRFALTGFDHAYFFLQGLHKYGKTFSGAPGVFGYSSVQTPLSFRRQGEGGYQNQSMIFVHYTPEHRVEKLIFK